jgi:hypothetical protein
VSWLYGGYFCGWYVLLGVGFVAWLTDGSGNGGSWGMIAFGAVAYFLVIPGLLFSLTPVVAKLSSRVDVTVKEGLARGAVSRGYAFAVGLVGSLVAMVTCAVGYGVACMEFPDVPADQLDDTWLDVAFVSMLMGVLAVIAVCPWLGQLLLLRKCRPREPGARRTWSWRIVPVALAMAWAGTVGWLGYRLANSTTVMTARLDFAALPASDRPLQEWLRSQPGVASAAVRREETTVVVECALCAYRSHSFSRWGNTVLIEYTTPGGERHSLHLTRVAAEAGYRGLRNATFEKPTRQW